MVNDFYKDLFLEKQTLRPRRQTEISFPKLGIEDKEKLTAGVSDEEIKRAMLQMHRGRLWA